MHKNPAKPTDEDVNASGEMKFANHILTDMGNVCGGKEPKDMRVLEIGCGAGRATREFAKMFGEVHAVGMSGAMTECARTALRAFPNAHVYQNDGYDLRVVPQLEFDFAYSCIVFQHIPSLETLANYMREVNGLLRPGALFKFCVRKHSSDLSPDDTWVGISPELASEMAFRCNFELRYQHDFGENNYWLWYFKKVTVSEQLENMRSDWDARARENARHFVATGKNSWTDEEFFASGDTTVGDNILTDMGNVCRGKDPKDMRVLEIGCGAGRITRALAKIFGEVHAVDISGVMVEQARTALQKFSNAHVYQNNGLDLTVVPQLEFDFAYSFIVFQHIPSYEIIENYVREVNRLLRPGALFKFQVQGALLDEVRPEDTWIGVGISTDQAMEMASRCNFELRYQLGAGEKMYWLWYFKC